MSWEGSDGAKVLTRPEKKLNVIDYITPPNYLHLTARKKNYLLHAKYFIYSSGFAEPMSRSDLIHPHAADQKQKGCTV